MIQKIASSLTEYSINRHWIASSKKQWCRYAIEKHLGLLLFASSCIFIAAITSTWLELFSFMLTFYFFRQRLGGCHANTFWSCQAVSIGTVVIVILIIGPILEQLNPIIIFGINALLILFTYYLKPAYPDSVHFSKSVCLANTKRKNQLLFLLIFLQLLNLAMSNSSFLIYSFLGLATTDFSVAFQIHLQQHKKGREKHEDS